MSKFRQKFFVGLVILVPLAITGTYNACGRVGSPYLSSTNSSLGSKTCVDPLMNTYSKTFHPFLVSNCNGCHATSQGSSNPTISFQAFMSKGESVIIYQATHAHGGNSFGPQMQAQIDPFLPTWRSAVEFYNGCMSKSDLPPPPPGGGGTGPIVPSVNLKTVSKTVPTVNMNTYVNLVFDLERDFVDQTKKFPLTFTVQVKYLVSGGKVVGFQFLNPTAQLKAGTTMAHQIGDIRIILDDVVQDFATTYANTLATISTTTATAIAPNYGAAIAYYETAATTSKIAFEIRKLGNGTSGGGGGGGGGGTPPPAAAVTFTQLNSTDPALGVFRNSCVSCHSAANPRGGLDLTNYTASKAKAAAILGRMKDAVNPMPTGGLLQTQFVDKVQAWVDNGAPQ